MRIGQGYDVHAFGSGTGLILGGVSIPFDRAFEAHSDGDVLVHALSFPPGLVSEEVGINGPPWPFVRLVSNLTFIRFVYR